MDTLTQTKLRFLLDYDQTTGVFTWRVNKPPRAKAGDRPMSPTKAGYLRVRIDNHLYYQHRLAWLYVNGTWPSGKIDHINGDVRDNRIGNLRDVDHRTNLQNLRSPHSDNRTGKLGVSRTEAGKYTASIKVQNKRIRLGRFDSAEAAHEAYLLAKRELHKGCTI